MSAPGASRYHVSTTPAPLPFASPARFRLVENDEYVKYGKPPFTTPERGDAYWTPEIITQTWFMAERGKIPNLDVNPIPDYKLIEGWKSGGVISVATSRQSRDVSITFILSTE